MSICMVSKNETEVEKEIKRWIKSLDMPNDVIADSVMHNIKKSKRPHMKKIILEALELKEQDHE